MPSSELQTMSGNGLPAIEVDRLGVHYSLRLTRLRTIRRNFLSFFRRGKSSRFWALRNFSLAVRPGEVVAVIGPNGAGKTTLLQTLAGIIKPSEGTVTVRGAVSAFLGAGAVFDPSISGRDNIALFAAYLGVDAADLRERTEAIIRFADIGDFIDAPMKTYSQGMRARLGFSIVSLTEPDVLLLDEVVSTGDEEYRTRSKERLLQMIEANRAIVLVTHDMLWVTEFCTRAVILERGAVAADGAPAEVVKLYQERAATLSASHESWRPRGRMGRR
jgi:ABC-2 type transport system ATP-binding protein